MSFLAQTTTLTFADNSSAQQLYQAGKYQEALIEYNKLVQTNPVIANYIGLGLTYQKLNHKIHAIAALQEALRINPNHLDAQAVLAQYYIQLQDFNSAKPLVESLYAQYVDNLNVVALYLGYLIGIGDYQKGLELVPFLLEHSSHAGILNNVGLIYIETGDMSKAIEIFRKGFRCMLAKPLPPTVPKAQEFMDQNIGKAGLLAIKKVLDELKIPFLLFAGTILGIYRDGDILPHDKDVDLLIPWSVPRVELIHTLRRYGFVCNYSEEDIAGEKGQWNISVVHLQTGVTIDFFFCKVEDGKLVTGIHKNGKTLYGKMTNTGRSQIEYVGQSFWTLGDLDNHLAELYGKDWRTPQANYNTLILSETVYDPDGVGIALCYNHCLGALCEAYYKKGHGYTMQLLSVHDDLLLQQVKEYLEKNLNEKWYPPIPYRQKRSNNKDLFGIED